VVVSEGVEPAAEKARDHGRAPEEVVWRPRWRFLGVFAALATIHLVGGWTSTSAIGLALGFGCTVVLVFVPRLPPWVTGEWSRRPWSRSWLRAHRNRFTILLLLAWSPTALVAGSLVEHPPHGVDLLYGVLLLAGAVSLMVLVVVRWVRIRGTVRLLAGPPTPLPARVDEREPADDDILVPHVAGTLTFPDGTPGYFVLRDCPRALAAAIENTERLWVTPARPGAAIVAFPDSDDFAHATLESDRLNPHGHKPVSRTALNTHRRLRTSAFATAVVLSVALEIAAFVAVGGWLPWVLAPLILLALAATANWRWHVLTPARLLAAGPWTEVAAAVIAEDIRPGLPMPGWAQFPDGIRARFCIMNCPFDIAVELLSRRRLWIAGEPREGEVAIGLPDGDTFAVAIFTVKDRTYRRAKARRSPSPGNE
jgi:hypothetical protein